MQNQKSKNCKAHEVKVRYRRTEYLCTKKDGKITVRCERTANGQNMVTGIYNIEEGTWYRGHAGNTLESGAKREILEKFHLD